MFEQHAQSPGRIRGWLLAFLVAAYVSAQAVALLHAARHLSPDRSLPHATACVMCAVAAEAGGAPEMRLPGPQWVARRHESPVESLLLQRVTKAVSAYRSRGPPLPV